MYTARREKKSTTPNIFAPSRACGFINISNPKGEN